MDWKERYAHIQAMISDDGGTWDLSDRDRQALRWVLGMVNLLADELAYVRGTSVVAVMQSVGQIVLAAQAGRKQE